MLLTPFLDNFGDERGLNIGDELHHVRSRHKSQNGGTPYKLVHKYTTTNHSVRMPPELTLETLAKNIEDVKVLVAKVAEDDNEHKEKEAKKAEHEKEEEKKMEAKKAKYSSAIKTAMEEDDHDKKMAMVKQAEDEYNDKKHEAFGDPDKKEHDANEDEKKEHDAQIASIIADKKKSLINQILTANRIINPASLKEIEARLKTAGITEIEKEWSIVKPFVAGVETSASVPQEKFVPYFANVTPADIDSSTLSAASPASDFNKFSTKELLEMDV